MSEQPKMADDPVYGQIRQMLCDGARASAQRRGIQQPGVDDVYTAAIGLVHAQHARAERAIAALLNPRESVLTVPMKAHLRRAMKLWSAFVEGGHDQALAGEVSEALVELELQCEVEGLLR